MKLEKIVENLAAGVLVACALIIAIGLVAIAIKAIWFLTIIVAAFVAIYLMGAFVNKKGWLG